MSHDIRIYVNVVVLILDHFLETIKATKCNDEPHFDIELTKENGFNTIYVTNCDCENESFRGVLVSCYDELRTRIKFDSYFEAVTTFVKAKSGEQFACDLRCTGNDVGELCFRHTNAQESRRFAHLSVYQSFMFKTTLPSKGIVEFKENLSRSIMALIDVSESCVNAKYTFRCSGKTIYQNHVIPRKDMISCNIISSAIKKIIETTRSDEFRTQCFSLLGVRSSGESRDAVRHKLATLLSKIDQEKMRNDTFTTFSKNDRTRENHETCGEKEKNHETCRKKEKNDETYREKEKNDETCREKEKNDETYREKKIDEVSLPANNDQANTRAEENNQSHAVVPPIIMSSRGRRIKRKKFFEG